MSRPSGRIWGMLMGGGGGGVVAGGPPLSACGRAIGRGSGGTVAEACGRAISTTTGRRRIRARDTNTQGGRGTEGTHSAAVSRANRR